MLVECRNYATGHRVVTHRWRGATSIHAGRNRLPHARAGYFTGLGARLQGVGMQAEKGGGLGEWEGVQSCALKMGFSNGAHVPDNRPANRRDIGSAVQLRGFLVADRVDAELGQALGVDGDGRQDGLEFA